MVNSQAQEGCSVGTEPGAATVAARIACLDVVLTFFQLVDAGQASRALELFTQDAEMLVADNVLRGDALAAAMRGRETDGVQRLHFPGESSFRLLTDETAEAETLFQMFVLNDQRSKVPTAKALGQASDAFARGEDGIWRISRRRVHLLAGE